MLCELLSEYIVNTFFTRYGNFFETSDDIHYVWVVDLVQHCPLIKQMTHLFSSAALNSLENQLKVSLLNKQNFRAAAGT